MLAVLRQHWLLLVVLGAATSLRVWFVFAYPYAFFFSDSRPYIASAIEKFPASIRPWGYSFFLQPFVDQPYIRIAILQHILGLALIVLGYAFLRRRGVRPWVSAVAMLPLALDARVLTLEHYVLAETAYLLLTGAGLMLIAWRDKVGWLAAALGGTLLAAAAVTRTVGLPVLALAGVYLLVRRAGILRLAAFALPVMALLGGYLVWYHQTWGVYAFGQYQGRFLYARVMPIADCSTLKLTDEQRKLCMPNAPASWAQRPDQYIWNPSSPANRIYPNESDDPYLNDFAMTVIKQEPGKYLAMVGEQTGWHLILRAPVTDKAKCLSTMWLPPPSPGDDCQARYYLPITPGAVPPPNLIIDNPSAQALHSYGTWVTTPGPLYAVGIVVALFAAVWRFRRRPWRDAADALLFTFAGFGLILVSVATSMFDYRYAEPAVLLIPIGLALAATRIAALAKAPAPAAAAQLDRTEPDSDTAGSDTADSDGDKAESDGDKADSDRDKADSDRDKADSDRDKAESGSDAADGGGDAGRGSDIERPSVPATTT